jgi:uncharacterized protein (DUF58 family)
MLDEALIAKIRRIEITARRAVSDVLAGEYHSVFKGRGMAFSEVRLYQPGDDVRTIDWNVSARMQEPYVKVFTEERELTVMLLVDLSRSQDFGSLDKTKGEVAAEVAALLAFAAVSNNDRVGALLFSDRVERFLPPRKGRKHVLSLIAELLTARPQGRGTDLPGALAHLGRVIKRRSVAFVLSDFLVPSTPEGELALRAASRRHELVPIAIADPLEQELPNLGLTLASDPETGASFVVDLGDRRLLRRYGEAMRAQREARTRLFRRLELDHLELRGDQDRARLLARFFHARAARRAG